MMPVFCFQRYGHRVSIACGLDGCEFADTTAAECRYAVRSVTVNTRKLFLFARIERKIKNFSAFSGFNVKSFFVVEKGHFHD